MLGVYWMHIRMPIPIRETSEKQFSFFSLIGGGGGGWGVGGQIASYPEFKIFACC